MTRALQWLGFAAALILAVTAAGSCARAEQSAIRWMSEAERARQEKRIWQARYAEAATRVVRDVDTVRVMVRRVDTLRQTLNIHDTVSVLQYVATTDTALLQCSALADSCAEFRRFADSTIHAYRRQNDALERVAKIEHRKANLLPWVAGASFLLGAWVRGQ